jgi:hypothetical protein
MSIDWGLTNRAINILNQNGCRWTSLEHAKAFVADAVDSGRANRWYNCGRKTVLELRQWSDLDERKLIDSAVKTLKSRGFMVIPPTTGSDRKGK